MPGMFASVEEEGFLSVATRDSEEGSPDVTEEDILESRKNARSGRVMVGVVALSLLVCGVLVGVFVSTRGSLASRSTSNEGLRSTASKAEANIKCGGAPPPSLRLFFGKNQNSKCTLPTYLEGVWKQEKVNERRGVKSIMYTMTVAAGQSLFIYLDQCGYGSKNAHQSDCISQWVVNDPSQLIGARFENGVPTTIMHTQSCAAAPKGVAAPNAGPENALFPPIGDTQWTVRCREGVPQLVNVNLVPAQPTVEGAWHWQKCVDPTGAGSSIMMPTDLTGERGQVLPDADTIKAAMTQQFTLLAYKVSTDGLPSTMVDEMTKTFMDGLEKATAGSGKAVVKPQDGNSCLWVWKWTITGFTYVTTKAITTPAMELLDHTLTALTMSPDTLPKCVPGHASDAPFYQKCDSDQHKIPPTTLTAEENQIVTSVR